MDKIFKENKFISIDKEVGLWYSNNRKNKFIFIELKYQSGSLI